MTRGSRSGLGIGATLAVALAVAQPALASRPSAGTDVARGWHAVAHGSEVYAGRYVSGGGRGGRVDRRSRRDATLPSTTHRPSAPKGASVLVQSHDGRPRAPERAAGSALTHGRARVTRVAIAATDRRAAVPSAHYHQANAPPATASAVAGLDS